MNKSRWILTLAAIIVVAGLGTGAIAHYSLAGAPSATPQSSAALNWFPAGASVVGYMNIEALMASPLREEWERQIEAGSSESLEEFRTWTGMDPFTDFYSLSFSVEANEEDDGRRPPERWGLVLNGEFDPDGLIAKIEEHSQTELRTEEVSGTTVYLLERSTGDGDDGDHDREAALAFADPTTALFGHPEYLRAMLAAGADDTTPAVLQNWDESQFIDETFWIVGAPQGGLSRMFQGPAGASGPELPPIEAFAVSGRLDAEVDVTARGKAIDAESAEKLAEVVRGFVALGSLQSGSQPEISAVVDSVQIAQFENEVEVSLSVPYETLRRLSRRSPGVEGQQEN